MSNKINIEQKLQDYSIEIDLLERKKALLEANKDTSEIDRQLEIFKVSVQIREKDKLRSALIPVLEQENQKQNNDLDNATRLLPEAIETLKPIVNDLEEVEQKQYFGIRNLQANNTWQAPEQRVQAFGYLVNLIRKYNVQTDSEHNNQDEQPSEGV